MMPIFKALAWATAILMIAFAGRAAGMDPEPLVLMLSGAAAVGLSQPGRCGGLA